MIYYLNPHEKNEEKREEQLKIIYNPEKKIDIVENMPERKGPPKR